MSTVAEDTVRRYLGLPYRIALTRDDADEELPWRAVVEELAGCEVRGSTPADAAARVPAALAEWVANAHAEGRDVPEPRDPRNYSGKLLLRMSRTLHGELSQAAERDQVSLNAYINYVLATALQHPAPFTAVAAPAWDQDGPDEPATPAPDTVRLQRFLAIALAANVAVATVVAVVAVILLLTAA